MNTILWEKLREHLGHNVVIVGYGDDEDLHNLAIECENCGAVIVDCNNPNIEEAEGTK